MATNLTFATDHTNVVEILAFCNETLLFVSENPAYNEYEHERRSTLESILSSQDTRDITEECSGLQDAFRGIHTTRFTGIGDTSRVTQTASQIFAM